MWWELVMNSWKTKSFPIQPRRKFEAGFGCIFKLLVKRKINDVLEGFY